jgi:large subunit ribosomal protein L30
MKKLKITQIKSTIDRPKRQKDTVKALGLRKLNHSVEVSESIEIKGMINKVSHLLKVEEI